MRGWLCWLVMLFGVSAAYGAVDAGNGTHTNPINLDPLAKEAYHHFNDLDYAGAIERIERLKQQHPTDPQVTAMLLHAVVFQELFRVDLLDTTFYANDGFLTGKHPTPEDPAVRDHIFHLEEEAVSEADARLKANPNDVDALYARGWAKALRAAYVAMVERGFGAGFHLAIQAHGDHQKVLDLDPKYVDANLVVGVYQHVVGALPWEFKLLIGFAGISGNKARGMMMLREAADHGVITPVEAKTVLALFLRRQGKYAEAIEVVRGLKAEYPRDFLFCLEEANLKKDAGEGMRAVDAYRSLLTDAAKPGYFPAMHLDLAYFGLGESLRGQRHFDEAAEAYEKASATAGVGAELKRRSLVAAGQCRDLAGKRQQAVADYNAALAAGSDTTEGDRARRYLHSAYHE